MSKKVTIDPATSVETLNTTTTVIVQPAQDVNDLVSN